MKRLQLLLAVISFIAISIPSALFGQGTIKGILTDEAGDALIGANVYVVEHEMGATTDIDGAFMIADVPEGAATLRVTYIGYAETELPITVTSGMNDMGSTAIAQDALGLDEVVVTGVMDIVRDRKTPVAVSTITTADIRAHAGNVEFPELMKATPSIYVAGQAGGYGDSEVFTRGFDQTNTAFLLNGQPINGMEDGKMYWSNWSGMTDVASAVQVQRGLGSSKLAISSVGGTTNIIMKSTEQRKGGSVSYLLGNDGYNKVTASYNTGLVNNKFGLTVLMTHWQGNGWAEGTKGQGQNYFISAGYKPDDKRHNFNFLLTGAPQWHDQNFNKRISSHYQGGNDFNIKFNNNYGTLDGEYKTLRRNFYHKPVANLNWDFQVSDKSKMSAVLYASWGRGGGTGDRGSRNNRFFTSDGYIDWDAVEQANIDDAGSEEWIIRASVNNHNWVGAVFNYETELTDALTWSVGSDLRRYHGSHFRQVVDLVGAPAFSQGSTTRYGAREVTTTFEANPWKALSNSAEGEEKIHYSNDETIAYAGIFSQLEYAKNNFSGYFQGALSSQSHIRFEEFWETPENEESEKVSNLGFNLKGGFSIETGANSNIFFNTGFYQRQPFHDNIYLNFSNFVNEVTVPEKIFGLEAGYKIATQNFTGNINLYRTSWKDKATTRTLREGDMIPNGTIVGIGDWYRNTLQNQLHSGLELDFAYKASSTISVKGYASFGDWAYEGSIVSNYFDDGRNLVYSEDGTDIDGSKVGGAAQTTFGLGADLRLAEGFKLDVDYFSFANLYSNVSAGNDVIELPSYSLVDLGASYIVNMSNDQLLRFRVNVYNAFGTEYISRATSAFPASTVASENWNGVNQDNFVTFGKTATWNVSVGYTF